MVINLYTCDQKTQTEQGHLWRAMTYAVESCISDSYA